MTLPVLSLTLAIFLSPELGFLGLVVPTLRHTPFSSGRLASWGDRSFRAFWAILPCRRTWISVHLFARDAGVGRKGSAARAFWTGVAPMAGRKDRAVARGVCAKREGRTRRRRNWTGMAAVVSSSGHGHPKVQDAARMCQARACTYPSNATTLHDATRQ
jgi:hypothetical protein